MHDFHVNRVVCVLPHPGRTLIQAKRNQLAKLTSNANNTKFEASISLERSEDAGHFYRNVEQRKNL